MANLHHLVKAHIIPLDSSSSPAVQNKEATEALTLLGKKHLEYLS